MDIIERDSDCELKVERAIGKLKVGGRRGRTVRKIMERTGAVITVQKAEGMRPGRTDWEVTICGTEGQQKEALPLVSAEVARAKAGACGAMLGKAPEVGQWRPLGWTSAFRAA